MAFSNYNVQNQLNGLFCYNSRNFSFGRQNFWEGGRIRRLRNYIILVEQYNLYKTASFKRILLQMKNVCMCVYIYIVYTRIIYEYKLYNERNVI